MGNPPFHSLSNFRSALTITETYNPNPEETDTIQIVLENPNTQPRALPTVSVGYLEIPEQNSTIPNQPYVVHNLNQVTQSLL